MNLGTHALSLGNPSNPASNDSFCLGVTGSILVFGFSFMRNRGQIFILEIIGLRRASIQFLSKQTGSKVKDKDLIPIPLLGPSNASLTFYDYFPFSGLASFM